MNVVEVTSLEVISSEIGGRNSLERLECRFHVVLSHEQIGARERGIHAARVVRSNHRLDAGFVQHTFGDAGFCS